MVFFNKVILDQNSAVVLEKAKVDGYKELIKKFLHARLPCPHSNNMGAAMRALAVEYQSAINNTYNKCKIHSLYLSLDILIAEARKMYKICSLRRDTHADYKKTEVSAAASSTGSSAEQICFKCSQPGHVKKDCPKKGQNSSNVNSNSTNSTECP